MTRESKTSPVAPSGVVDRVVTLTELSRHVCRPRWLVEHGQTQKALKTLQYYREGYFTHEEINAELDDIERSVASCQASGLVWTSLFTDRSLFARLWRSALLQFMGQMCGATAMKYYLPALFEALGLSHRVSLLAGGIESTMKIGCTLIDMVIIDRVGRRITLTAGAAVMAVAMMVGLSLFFLQLNLANQYLGFKRSTAFYRSCIPITLTG